MDQGAQAQLPGGARGTQAKAAWAAGCRRVTALGAVTATVFFSSSSLVSAPRRGADDCSKAEDCFRRGIQALDLGKWDDAVKLMDASLKKKPAEDGQLVRIYGTRYQSYLPHYYRGLALYNQQKSCVDALKEWDESLKAGAVQRAEERGVFNAYLTECQKRLLTEQKPAAAPQKTGPPSKLPGAARRERSR